MKNNILPLVAFFACQATAVLGQNGFEQYYYLNEERTLTWVPIVHVQSRKNWYVEGRYNYEEQNTFSLYGGKSFSKTKNKLSYSITPILGGVVGQFKGGSMGLNTTIEYKYFFFSSQSQFTFSLKKEEGGQNFLFSWTELGFEFLPNFYLGCSVQHTLYTQEDNHLLQPGVLLGFTSGKWTFPVYGFCLFETNRYFILGINYAIGTIKNQHQL